MTPEGLVALERRFAPTVGAAPAVFSPSERIRTDPANAGGDKMASDRNGYAEFYATILDGFTPEVVVELGVFQGASLAMWEALWPAATLYGIDLDFARFDANLPFLRSQGADLSGVNRILWDAYSEDAPVLPRFDLFIDDGPHTDPAIRNVVNLLSGRLREGGLYVVEDFDAASILRQRFPNAELFVAGRIAAVRL